MLKAIKIQLYPNKTQTTQINKLLGCYRVVYNNCLSLKKEEYENNKINLNLKELGNYFHNNLTKNDEYFYLNEQNTKVLKQSIINLLDAYKRFFEGKGTVGYPKFKSKNDYKLTCRFPLEAISKMNVYQGGKLSLANIKNLKFKCSDKYKNYLNKYKDSIKSATLTKTRSGKYFLSILVDGTVDKILPKSNNVVGIDLGVKDFVITSDSEIYKNLHFYKSVENRIKRLQRKVSKKVKGSNNRDKARKKLARLNEVIFNKKQAYLHDISNQLLNENQVIVIEDLNVSGMLKNHNLAKAIQEMSFSELRRMLEYKAEWYGREIVVIDRWFPSSKLCSVCGYKKRDLKLSDREWECPECGSKHDRDINAAVNIRKEGERINRES